MKNPSKHTGLGIALGAALGAVAGVVAGNIGVWLAIGVAIGLALGYAMREKPSACPQCLELHRAHEKKELESSPQLEVRS
jgi:hypothetical protein